MHLPPTSKDKIEKMCRAAGLKPERRSKIRGLDVLIADGFSLPPHNAFRRFGVAAKDFPRGCYVTFWWLMKGEERMFIGCPLMFEALHDPELGAGSKKLARINAALKHAREIAENMKRKSLNG